MAVPRPRRLAPLLVALAGAAVLAAGCGGAPDPAAEASADVPPPAERGPAVLRGAARLIDGDTLSLAGLRGSVVLVVNTASRCGYTPQFEGLEELNRAGRERGLRVIGFPSDDFGQELDEDAEVGAFCRLNYGVSFPMAGRTHVLGSQAHPLFAAIAARPGAAGEPPSWNFTKYLLDREGRLVARFDPSVEPGDPALRRSIDRRLVE
jgi:glutathione peroxidase